MLTKTEFLGGFLELETHSKRGYFFVPESRCATMQALWTETDVSPGTAYFIYYCEASLHRTSPLEIDVRKVHNVRFCCCIFFFSCTCSYNASTAQVSFRATLSTRLIFLFDFSGSVLFLNSWLSKLLSSSFAAFFPATTSSSMFELDPLDIHRYVD